MAISHATLGSARMGYGFFFGATEQARAPLVAPRDQLEEQVRGIGLERQVAQLVDDQQLWTRRDRQLLVQRAIAMSLGQHRHQCCRGDELHAVILPNRLSPQGDSQMRLAGPWRAG